MKPLRVPAGVYVDGVPMGGRFVAPGDLPGLIAEAGGDGPERVLALLYSQLDRAMTQYENAERRFDDGPKRYAIRRYDAEQKAALWESVAEQAETLFQEPDDEPIADEWEISFDYEASGGSSSNVDINIRVSRFDGKEMGQAEAASVLKAFRDNLSMGENHPVPHGYRMAAINWRRPGHSTGWRPRDGSGTVKDLEAFNDVLYAGWTSEGSWDVNAFGPVRMGRVKE